MLQERNPPARNLGNQFEKECNTAGGVLKQSEIPPEACYDEVQNSEELSRVNSSPMRTV